MSTRAAFDIGHESDLKTPLEIKNAITEQLVKWFGEVPRWKVESIGVSAGTYRVWVRVKVFSTKLNHGA